MLPVRKTQGHKSSSIVIRARAKDHGGEGGGEGGEEGGGGEAKTCEDEQLVVEPVYIYGTMCFHLSVDKYSILVGGVGNNSTVQDDEKLSDVVILCVCVHCVCMCTVCTVYDTSCVHCATIKLVADAHVGVYGDCKTFKWC